MHLHSLETSVVWWMHELSHQVTHGALILTDKPADMCKIPKRPLMQESKNSQNMKFNF